MDVIVIGGGASGMMAAVIAAKKANVTIIEKNTVGKKLLITGNGKCNYWNIDNNIDHYYSTNKNLINEILKHEKETLEKLNEIGIVPRIKNGKYYPFSNQAVSVQNAFLEEIKRLKIKIIKEEVIKIEKKEKFIVNGKYKADKIIYALGSKANSQSDKCYEIIKKLNHKVIKPLPALVPLKTKENIKECSGVRIEANIKYYKDNKFIKEEIGEIQFTDYGISGICTMQLSNIITRNIKTNKNEVVINLVYRLANTKEELAKILNKNKTITNILDAILNYKLTNYILRKLKINNKLWSELTQKEKDLILKTVLEFRLEIIDTCDFNKAQVCSGGIPLTEINSKMESKIVKDLFIIGEVLDINADCGGYNLKMAFITGLIAGKSI